MEKSLLLLKLLNSSGKGEVQGCPAKTAISAISAISPKLRKTGEIAVFAKIN